MSYTERFIDGLEFLAKVSKGARRDMGDISLYRDHIAALQTPEMREQYVKPIEVLTALSEAYVENFPGNLANKCHAVSHGFLRSWETSDFGDVFPLAVTIGNVYYKGQCIYNVSKSALKKILSIGKDTEEKLNVHVWLTLDDMTVFDLTVLSSLAAMEITPPIPVGESPVLVWREESPGDFNYEPLLIHNAFFDLVDRGSEDGFVPLIARS